MRPDSKKLILLLGICSASLPMLAFSLEQGGHNWGGFRAKPSIDLNLLGTDNFYRTRSNRTHETITTVTPSLNLSRGSTQFKYALDLGMEAGFHNTHDEDDYVDIDIGNTITFSPGKRLNFAINLDYSAGHESKGTGRQESLSGNLVQDADEFSVKTAGATLTYGLPGNKAQIIVASAYDRYDYTNNRAFTKARDYDDINSSATFKYNIGPKTAAFIEGQYGTTEYDRNAGSNPLNGDLVDFSAGNNGTTSLDSTTKAVFLGAEWVATAKTTGSIKVGRMSVDFDDDIINATTGDDGDFTSGAWEAAVTWSPRSYSKFTLATGRNASETTGFGYANVSDYYNVAWNHDWSNRLSSEVSMDYSNNSYEATDREDDLYTSGLSAHYRMKKWLTFSAGFDHANNESTENAAEYEVNDIYFNAKIDL